MEQSLEEISTVKGTERTSWFQNYYHVIVNSSACSSQGDRQTDEQAGGAAEQLHVVQITLSIINHDKKTTATAMNATKDESEMCVDHYS
jgi:hypothetical protein